MNETFEPMTVAKKTQTALSFCLIALMSGCAAWTNPVANGIPVRMVPDKLLAESKEGYEPIPWALLQRSPQTRAVLVAGDVLGIYIEGVLGDETRLPPVNIPASADLEPSMGYPIPVRKDGTISLPLIPPLEVAGLSLEDAEQKLIEAYTEDQAILQPGEERIILTMVRRKHVRLLVVRQDSLGRNQRQFIPTERGLLGNSVTAVNSTQESRGFEVNLPAAEADVLTALARTGGLPGIDAKPEVLIYRRADREVDETEPPEELSVELEVDRLNLLAAPHAIPLRRKTGEKVNIREADISLNDGDIVVIGVRKPEFYYTGGLLRNQQIPMPLDIDLTASEAVMRSGGPLVNGGFGGGNFQGTIITNTASATNPSLLTVLRKGPHNQRIPIRVDLNEALRDPREDILIQDGDTLVLQQTTGEAFSRYMLDALDFTGGWQIFSRGDASGSGVIRVP